MKCYCVEDVVEFNRSMQNADCILQTGAKMQTGVKSNSSK